MSYTINSSIRLSLTDFNLRFTHYPNRLDVAEEIMQKVGLILEHVSLGFPTLTI